MDDKSQPHAHFKTSPKTIRLAVMMSIRYPLSLRNVEDLLHELGSVHNHSPMERHHKNCAHFKLSRAAALAVWRGLLAA